MAEEPLLLEVPDATRASDGTEAPAEGERELDDAGGRLRRMVQAHFDSLWAFMRRLGVLEMDLDDAMQEVIVVAAERLADIAPPSERSFLFSTAFRVGCESRRKRGSRREVSGDALLEHADPIPEPDALAEQARARVLLDRMLEDMSPELRAVFSLYEIDEMTMSEIAELLALPPGTVASRLRRAREEFDQRVERLQAQMDARAWRARR